MTLVAPRPAHERTHEVATGLKAVVQQLENLLGKSDRTTLIRCSHGRSQYEALAGMTQRTVLTLM